MRWRVVTDEESRDFHANAGVQAAVLHMRNVCANRTSVLLQSHDDALPDEELKGGVMIDSYTASEVRAGRESRPIMVRLGEPGPAWPFSPATSNREWHGKAYYYAMGQIDALNDLSPLTNGDASSFAAHFSQWVVGVDDLVGSQDMRAQWVEWSTARLASLRDVLRPAVDGGSFHGRPVPGIDYLVGGEHDPDLGPDTSGDERP